MRAPLFKRQPPRHRPAPRIVFGPPSGEITGSVAFAFTVAGTLTGAGALAGTAALSFTVTGALTDLAAPVVESGGGDRGINLLRGEKKPEPEKIRIPSPVKIRARTEQPPQASRATIEVESELRLASFGYGNEVEVEIETESLLAFATEQYQVIELAMTTGQVQGRSVPVKPHFEAARMRADSEGGLNEAKAVIEVE